MSPAPEAAESSGGYCIKIEVRGDGTFSVGKYPLMPEGPAQGMTGGKPMSDKGGKEFTDIAEAFKYAAELYQQNPVQGSEQENMMAAYGEKPGPMGR